MKVSAIDTFVLRCQLSEPFGYSQAWYSALIAMLVRLTAADGRVDWGEAFGPSEPSAAIVQHVLSGASGKSTVNWAAS